MSVREDLHRLVDLIPDAEGDEARRLLLALIEKAGDPFLIALATAPEDDEPETPEGREAVRVARQELAHGEGRPWEDVRQNLGLD